MASSTIKKPADQYVTEIKTSSEVSVAAGAYQGIDIAAAKTGYTPIGILTFEKSGGGSGHCVISNMSISGTTLKLGVRNQASTAGTVIVKCNVLYKKTS